MNKLSVLLLIAAGALFAQDADKVTVPLHDPSRPARIRVHLLMGGIIVRGADIKNVVVETHGGSEDPTARVRRNRRETLPASVDGMKRLDMPGNAGLDITEDNNLVIIRTGSWTHPGNLTITVPRKSSLELKSVANGEIEVEQVDGEIDAEDLNGRISLKDVSGSVVAHSLNGAVSATVDRLDSSKPSSLSTLNGNIDITLPDNVRANVRMKSDNGAIYSDFDVKLDPGTHVDENATGQLPNGKYHLRFDRTLRGTINGGGPDLQLTTFNGQIFIRKRK
ncbi:MAG: hypothetical protein JO217_15005 [Acidobacteriaceae bacterium]|nr:hypothetical protein [Acidobacteriaceae bacterium]MBV9443989.1 hypothetical protein [Acidobacteriaceae bacterium]